AGLTREEFIKLTRKYDDNILALAMAIKRGEEGVDLQKAMAEYGKKNIAVIDKQKEALNKVESALKEAADGEAKLAKATADANNKIAGMTKTLTDEVMKMTLTEYEYSKWALDQKLTDQLKTIGDSIANEDIRNTASIAATKARDLALEALDKDHKAKEVTRQKELTSKMTTMWGDFYAAVKAKQAEFESASEGVTDRLNQLTMDEYTYRLTVLDKKYGAEEAYWEKMIKATGEGEAELLKVITAHQIEIDRVKIDAAEAEKKRMEDEAAAKKQALENTLANISFVLNTIGGLFQQSFDLKMQFLIPLFIVLHV
ncbi:unnamed protein product, partial [marine sediment metagenome]